MAAYFPNGTVFAVSTARAANVPITAITNAAPPVASTATPPTDGSVVVLNTGWPTLNDRVIVSDGADVDSFELAGLDTTSTTRYPAGEGVPGSFYVASDFVNLSQVTTSEKQGGEQQFFTWQYLEDRSGRQRQRPTFKNAKSLTLTLDYDPALGSARA